MEQIADWLEKLGMPEYGDCFGENKIRSIRANHHPMMCRKGQWCHPGQACTM
jgi:hypothetical protein